MQIQIGPRHPDRPVVPTRHEPCDQCEATLNRCPLCPVIEPKITFPERERDPEEDENFSPMEIVILMTPEEAARLKLPDLPERKHPHPG